MDFENLGQVIKQFQIIMIILGEEKLWYRTETGFKKNVLLMNASFPTIVAKITADIRISVIILF